MKREFYLKPAKNINRFIVSSLIIAALFSACQKSKLDVDTLVRIYVENVIIEETFASNQDSIKIKKEELFERYKISRNEYETELNAIGADQKKWEEFFKKANALLEDLKSTGALK